MPVRREPVNLEAVSDEGLSGLLDGAFLVIAALSDPAGNDRVGRLCREKRILFNNADGEQGDVQLPSVIRGENYTIAVSTGGKSPAVARFLRERMESDYPALDAMIDLQQRLRGRLREYEPDQERRSAILRNVVSDPAVWSLLARDPALAWEDVQSRYLHG
jgi:precorrin-2 dehydrogenase/sirohydrochlorin ferrochelatase